MNLNNLFKVKLLYLFLKLNQEQNEINTTTILDGCMLSGT